MCPRLKDGELSPSWYACCCAYFALSQAMRKRISRQTRAHHRRIAHLPRHMGEQLDRLHAPFYVVRWIAWASDQAERCLRYAIAVESHERSGRWPYGKDLLTARRTAECRTEFVSVRDE